MGTKLMILAYGIHDERTGVERVALNVANQARQYGAEITLVVDEDARWFSEISGVAVVRMRRPILGVAQPLIRNVGEFDIIYSVAPAFPINLRRRVPRKVYTIHDWGPFKDSAMPARARLAWSVAILQGILRAKVLHTYSSLTPGAAPKWIRFLCGERWLFDASVASSHSMPDVTGEEENSDPYVLFVGSNVARKRIPLIVAAASHLRGTARVVLAGDGTEQFRGENNVTALGRVSDERLAGLYARAQALILISSYEGLGIPVLEATQYGTPCLVSQAVYELHKDSSVSELLYDTNAIDADGLARDLRILMNKANPGGSVRQALPALGPLMEYLLASDNGNSDRNDINGGNASE